MIGIENRLKKLEAVILPSDDQDDAISRMTPEERQHRIAQLIYKGLSDVHPEVMGMTEPEFIEIYLSMKPNERDIKYPVVYRNDGDSDETDQEVNQNENTIHNG